MAPNQLRYFLEIASTLNISRAAERLGVTQPTLSLAIQKLEEDMGVPLLIRSKSGVRLTKYGERLSGRAKMLLDQWEKIRAETLAEHEEVRGRFSIGCHASVALYALPEFLGSLLKQNLNLEIELSHDLSRKITEGVVSSRIDFGIVVNPVEHPDLVIQPLTKDEVTFWRGPKHDNLDVLICDPNLLQTQNLLERIRKKNWPFKRVVHSSSLEVVAGLVSVGAGVGVLPGRVATRDPHQKLTVFAEDMPVFHDRVVLIQRADLPRSIAVRTISEGIRAAFKA